MTSTMIHRWRPRGIAAGALLLSALGVGCAARSEMTDLWQDPSQPANAIHNVLVVGIRKDPVRRRMWEDAFVKGLASRGVTAISSYKYFPDAAPDTDQVIAAVRQNQYDAVLVSVRLPDETTSTFVPGAIRQERVTSQDYYGRFHSYWANVQDPGYTETDKIIRIQTDVWTTGPAGGSLVWSGTLRALESVNSQSVNSAVSKEILPRLAKHGVIPGKSR